MSPKLACRPHTTEQLLWTGARPTRDTTAAQQRDKSPLIVRLSRSIILPIHQMVLKRTPPKSKAVVASSSSTSHITERCSSRGLRSAQTETCSPEPTDESGTDEDT
ncbi:hypothetical protein CROQUDRAFT_94299 [Cronartium quercuum f. sp. fusiforme G11]|uniref:Uncharacterized protein n=1 Tax=Cronartium quercuum f. sp. fusiforme G11 TaxID=708437 RepID=A0A9P6NFM2_9BASI|nr:hypothetical protein CROQUDRAFT_94299 [Cronartium quercuum f. sp. fusiforme G11]